MIQYISVKILENIVTIIILGETTVPPGAAKSSRIQSKDSSSAAVEQGGWCRWGARPTTCKPWSAATGPAGHACYLRTPPVGGGGGSGGDPVADPRRGGCDQTLLATILNILYIFI